MRGNSASPAVTRKVAAHTTAAVMATLETMAARCGALPQPLGRIGILQQRIGDDEHGKTAVPQNVEPIRALQPGAKQATWREHARKGQQSTG